MLVHDLIGIGFGPSNIALAIALRERAGPPLRALFLERQAEFAWHPHMMLDGTHMQISFLKDLVTLRNPASPFSFLSYLHAEGRLQQFINLQTFFPSRHDFNGYLKWAADHFDEQVLYGEDVIEVRPEFDGDTVTLLRVVSRDAQGRITERLARNLIVSVGGRPNVPEIFAPARDDARVIHSSKYLSAINQTGELGRVAVVGAGQSAAEIFMDLHGHPRQPAVDLLIRGRALRPSDDSPFMNEIFNAEHTDYIYDRPPHERDALLADVWHTNYAAPDLALIERIYDVLYQQRVRREARHRLQRHCRITAVQPGDDGITLQLQDSESGDRTQCRYDAVVLATGYVRDQHRALLNPLASFLPDFQIDRNYRVRATDRLLPAIYVQGGSESTHGISDSLLSILAIRSQEIGSALLDMPADARVAAPVRPAAALIS